MYCQSIVFLVILTRFFCDTCTPLPTLSAFVYKTIDSDVANVTVSDVLSYEEDAFHLFVANECVRTLCKNSIQIKNELSLLRIINCSLADIESEAFQIVPTLTLLKISNNLLRTIKTGVFNNIKVKEIDLTNNLISNIEEEAFDNNTNLEILKLNYNALKEINHNWFQNSPNVYKLSVIFNELTKITPAAFKNLSKRRPLKLYLSANLIREISEDSFNNTRDIDVLRLNGNKLVSLPGGMFVNKTIGKLQLSTNRLLCFPETLYESTIGTLEFLDNTHFNCSCLRKVRDFVEKNNVDILYPSIICEDRAREVNLVFNFNKTYEIPLLPATTGG